jgi:cytidylate kinase
MISIAIDGPASSGKSSVGTRVAQRLGCLFLDTGLLYRAVTAAALAEGSVAEPLRLSALARDTRIEAADGSVGIAVGARRFVARDLERAEVEREVPIVAAIPDVRAALRDEQRAFARGRDAVLAGRDIGTVVLPDAAHKFFLDASPESRAERRARQRGVPIGSAEHLSLVEDLRFRDANDRSRAVAPLVAAADAQVIDTDSRTLDEVVELLVAAVLGARGD